MKKVILFFIFSCTLIFILYKLNIIEHKSYPSEYFGIQPLKSEVDFDHDGIDDYTDILNGAKETARKKVAYRSAYYDGGYPPDNEGVCTDVIWRSLLHAGYDLKSLVDEDIQKDVDAYYRVDGNPDPNIDFRRVPNLLVFFQRNTDELSTNIYEFDQWMPGDIVVFSDNHIAIVSDKRNANGVPFIIHNANQMRREEDILEEYNFFKGVSGHFRFNLKKP